MSNQTKVVTGIVRLSYANIWKPKAANEGAEPKYSCSLLIPKNDTKTVEAIKKAIEAALTEGADKFGGKIPNRAVLKLPLRDGDTEREDDDNYKGCYFINASSKNAPGVVDKNVQPILDQSEVYSGCYCRASINFYAFNASGNRGVACGLNNIQKIRDGEPLGGGRSNPNDDFSSFDDDDDFMN